MEIKMEVVLKQKSEDGTIREIVLSEEEAKEIYQQLAKIFDREEPASVPYVFPFFTPSITYRYYRTDEPLWKCTSY